MWPLVTLTLARTLYFFLGGVTLAARIFIGSGNTTGVNGGPISVPDFTTAGIEAQRTSIPIRFPFAAFVKGGTGSTTIKYPAACFRNPLYAIGKGSGTILRLKYHNGANPSGVGGDIGLVSSCGDSGGSGSTLLIDNTCTSSGCTSTYSTGTQDWNGAMYVKFTPRAALAAGFTARITGEVEDVWGE
jgi:hypothetical protein